jgi:hypothetical protein
MQVCVLDWRFSQRYNPEDRSSNKRCVFQRKPDVSEEDIASIFRAEE